MIQHMVMLKVKPEVAAEAVERVFSELYALRETIPGIQYVAGGAYSSPEGFNQGYTHGFLVTFVDAAARDAYLPHPAHERVKEALLAIVDAAVAFDFEDA